MPLPTKKEKKKEERFLESGFEDISRYQVKKNNQFNLISVKEKVPASFRVQRQPVAQPSLVQWRGAVWKIDSREQVSF